MILYAPPPPHAYGPPSVRSVHCTQKPRVCIHPQLDSHTTGMCDVSVTVSICHGPRRRVSVRADESTLGLQLGVHCMRRLHRACMLCKRETVAFDSSPLAESFHRESALTTGVIGSRAAAEPGKQRRIPQICMPPICAHRAGTLDGSRCSLYGSLLPQRCVLCSQTR